MTNTPLPISSLSPDLLTLQVSAGSSLLLGLGLVLVLAAIGAGVFFSTRKKKERERRELRDRIVQEAAAGKEKELIPQARTLLGGDTDLLDDLPFLEAVIGIFIRGGSMQDATTLLGKAGKKFPGHSPFADFEVDLLVAKRANDQASLDKILAAYYKKPERKDWLRRYIQAAMHSSSTTVSAMKAFAEHFRDSKDPKTLLYIAETYDKKKIFNETSQDFFQEMAGRDVQNPRWLYAKARCQQNLGKFEDAEKTVLACLELDQGYQPAQALLKLLRGEEDAPPAAPVESNAAPTAGSDNALPERYAQITELGRGGMGIVYKAFDEVLHRWVAIKVLQEAPGPELGEMKERFLSESRVMACLDHPVIPKVFDVSVKPPCYIALEFLEGTDLRAYLEKNPGLAIKQLAVFAQNLAEGFHHAAEKNVLHRDIKPENMMVENSGRVRILDFGLARFAQQKSNLTQTGLVVGTPWYMAPERLKGEQATVFSEIFAFGVTMYEMITGKRPFDGDDYSVIFFQEPKSIRQQRPDCPLELEVLILDCLNKNPANRPRSFAEIAKDLVRIQKKIETAK